jgi:hypothetical protein
LIFQNVISLFFNVKYHVTNTNEYHFHISLYCRDDNWSDDESDARLDGRDENEEFSHSKIIHHCNFGVRHLMNARLSSEKSLQDQTNSNTHDSPPHCLNPDDIDRNPLTDNTIKTFPTLLN